MFGVPECDYVPSLHMFCVRNAIGKSFTSGGFGMKLPVDTSHGNLLLESTEHNNEGDTTIPCQENENKEQGHDMETTPLPSKPSPPAEHLFIEEALFLYERGVLQVYDDDVMLNAQQLYGMLEPLHVPLPIYLAYAHLRAQDYRVLRHVSVPSHAHDSLQQNVDDSGQEHDNYKMIKQARLVSPPKTLYEDPMAIAFDVYRPNTQFRKTNPGTPDFYVSVASFAIASPTFDQLQSLMQACNGVPLRIATVSDSGVVIMFGVTNVGVPDISEAKNDDS